MNCLRRLVFLVSFSIAASGLYGQYSKYELKAGFVYRFAESLDWPNMQSADSFVIGILSAEQVEYKTFVEILSEKSIKGIPITVHKIAYSNLHLYSGQILYISSAFNKRIEDIVSVTEKNNILRITNKLTNKELTMINFIEEGEKISFEVNPMSIAAADIEMSRKLIILGGTEVDAAAIYKEMQNRLEREIERVKAMTKKIESQKQALDEQMRAIGFQSERLIQQREAMRSQERKLSEMEKKIEEGQELLEKQDILLMQGQEALFLSEKRKKEFQKNAEKYHNDILRSRKTLDSLQTAIDDNRRTIEHQRASLSQQELTIKRQQFNLYISLTVAFLLAVAAYFIYRNYRLKNRVNKVLFEKNEEISLQKHQLEEQTNILDSANRRLENSNEQISAGIRYAQTIQSAVLPSIQAISDYYECFVLFRPKDHVSGDFFWAKDIHKSGKDYFFAAVVDCTGHGVPGAFMSFVGNRILNQILVSEQELQPSKILTRMHTEVYKLFEDKQDTNHDGMVLSLVRIEQLNKHLYEIVFCGAKQAVYIHPAGSDELLRVRGTIKEIGSPHYDEIAFEEKKYTLPKGSYIYMLSDGIIDQNNHNRKKFGSQRLKSVLSQMIHKEINEQYQIIEGVLDDFQGDTEQRDDITLMGLRL